MVGNYRSSINAKDVFKLEPAIKAVDAKYWQSAMMMTDVLDYMPAENVMIGMNKSGNIKHLNLR